MPSRPPSDLDPLLRALWQQASAPRHFVQDAAQALVRLERIDTAWQHSAPMREVPLGALLAAPLGASQVPLGRAAALALTGLAATPEPDDAGPTTPLRPRRPPSAASSAAAASPRARQPVSPAAPVSPARTAAAVAPRRGPVPPPPAASPRGPISAAAAAATWAQRATSAGLGQALAQVVQRPTLATATATASTAALPGSLGAARSKATQPPWGTAIAQALRDAGIAPLATPHAADEGRSGQAHSTGHTPPAGPRSAGAAAAGQTGFAEVGQAVLDAIERLPSQGHSGSRLLRRRAAPASPDDAPPVQGLGEALAGTGQAVAGAVQATLAPVPGSGSLVPARATGGLQGLRGLAARAAAQAATASALTPAQPQQPQQPQRPQWPEVPDARTEAAAAPPPATAAGLDDDDLTQQLTRVLQREARRDGIDLDDVT